MAASEVRDAALAFEAQVKSVAKDKDGMVIRLSIHPENLPNDIILAPLGARWQVAMVRIGDDEKPMVPIDKLQGERAVAAAGALCRNDMFWAWTGVHNEAECVANLHRSLGISSRAELATNREARNRFNEMRDRFSDDARTGKITQVGPAYPVRRAA